ncbi:MAG: Na+/H+ antiporter NhaA [Gemmatimonadaceae bacterium]|nr:Na+/H+ antiporter NhaA [Gemmatimonadaceae bacterium]
MTGPLATPDDDGLISARPQPPSQAVSGLVLLLCAVGALLWANSRWQESYTAVWHLAVGPTTLQHVINDGLMALFFLLVGLEIKHEVLDGALASWQRAALPVVGAIGGMLMPAVIYALIARGTDAAPGWGIPMATDIAFALGIVALLGDRVPPGLRVFLAALAIADDIGAVLVIAVFYTPQVAWTVLGVTALLLLLLVTLNRRGVSAVWPYALLGVALWFAVFRSGIHASIAGVLLALTIPARGAHSVQHRIERALQHPVTFGVVPLFALANAGVTLPADLPAFVREPAVLAAALGLIVGKPLGIVGAAWLAVRARLAALPDGADWYRVVGVATLGGIGFTMSLFIAGLAFNDHRLDAAKVGVLSGSLLTGVLGAVLLARANRRGVRA